MYPGYWPNDPGMVDSGQSPIQRATPDMFGIRRDMRVEQVTFGSTPPIVVENGYPVDSLAIPDPVRWPGPIHQIGRQFRPNLGAMAGMLEYGDRQDWAGASGTLRLAPPNIPWAVKQAHSLRSVSQQFNSSAAAVGVPAVFVPTSPSNAYGQLGSY